MAERLDDARFLKSEKLLLAAAAIELSTGQKITIERICQRAGVFTSTFYRHYKTLGRMLDICERRLTEDFLNLLREAEQKRLSHEVFFRRWGILIYQNREAFRVLLLAKDLNAPVTAISVLRSFATRGWRSSPEKVARIYKIYCYEVVGIWSAWAKEEDFDFSAIEHHAKELAFLTHTALQRLGGLP